MSLDLAFQKVLFAQITTSVLGVPVTASPLHNQVLPYIVIGQSEVLEHPAQHELVAYVHQWSKTEGPDQVKTYQHSIRTALHGNDFVQDGFKFTNVREEFADTLLDPDDETWHGVQRFRCVVCS